MGKLFCPGPLDRWNTFLHLALDHLIILNSFAYPKFSQMFPKTSFFFRKHLLSDFWGIKAILKHIYRFFLLNKKNPTDLDPTDLGLVFDILTHLGPIPRTQELRDKKGKRALDLAGQMPGMLVMPVMCLQEKEGLRIASYRAINPQKKGTVFYNYCSSFVLGFERSSFVGVVMRLTSK